MPDIEELFELARRNEEIAQRLFDIEVQIMNLGHCKDFYEQLISLIKERFSLDFVWVALADSNANEYLVRSLKQTQETEFRVVSTLDFLQATKGEKDPILVNASLGRYRTIIPGNIYNELASIAILPLQNNGSVIGSLNLGARDAERYSPEKDSFFLRQLAVKASISLAGVAAREQINFLATRDPLTRLRNRRELEDCLEREMSRSYRHKMPLALMFIDCDDFKLVNDTYGHDCGDAYLKQVADNLNELTRKSDLAFRFAGDEFVLILPNQSIDGADIIAQRVKEHMTKHPLRHQGKDIPIKISYGVASTDELREWTQKALLKAADERLYKMKKLKPSAVHH